MRFKRLGLPLTMLMLLAASFAFAQEENMEDAVYLKNGRVVYGTITDRVPGKRFSIKTESGYVFSYDASEIKRVTKERVTTSDRHPYVGANSGLDNFLCGNVGLSAPSGPSNFTDNWGTGLSLGAGFGFGISPNFSFVISGQYASFPLNYGYYYQGVQLTASGGGIQMLTLLANGKFIAVGQGNPAALYFIGGLGPGFLTFDTLTATAYSGGYSASATVNGFSETDMALRLGVGVDYVIGNHTSVFGELDLVDAFVSSKVIAGGGTLSHSQLSVGMKFDLPTSSGSEGKQ